MLCPRCGAINKDNTRQCRECGVRLAGVRVSPEAKKAESKYLISGIVAFIGIVLVIVLLVTSVCCVACKSGCIACSGDESYINENVDGDWDSIDVSDTDIVSSTDEQLVDSTADNSAVE